MKNQFEMCLKKLVQSAVIVCVCLGAEVSASEVFTDDTPVTVTSTAGVPVSVSVDEIRNAYLAIAQRKSRQSAKITLNEDGSVAINQPTFEYNGRLLRLWANPHVISVNGICKFFGFNKCVGFEPEKVPANSTFAVIGFDSKLGDLVVAPGNANEFVNVMGTIACQ